MSSIRALTLFASGKARVHGDQVLIETDGGTRPAEARPRPISPS